MEYPDYDKPQDNHHAALTLEIHIVNVVDVHAFFQCTAFDSHDSKTLLPYNVHIPMGYYPHILHVHVLPGFFLLIKQPLQEYSLDKPNKLFQIKHHHLPENLNTVFLHQDDYRWISSHLETDHTLTIKHLLFFS